MGLIRAEPAVAKNLTNLNLQDRATKWHGYLSRPPTHAYTFGTQGYPHLVDTVIHNDNDKFCRI